MKVKFLTPVQHDAQSYQEGDSADLPTSAAKSLIDCGAAEASDQARAKARASAQAEEQAAADEAAQAATEADDRAALGASAADTTVKLV